MHTHKKSKLQLYIGTYSVRGSAGIYTAEIMLHSGKLELAGEPAPSENPSFLALDPKATHLYATNESADLDGQRGGALSSFAIDGEAGTLTFLNRQPSEGLTPLHLGVDGSGRFLLAANYHSGSVSVHALQPDGSIGRLTDLVQHSGSGADPERQEGPHAHSVTLGPSNRFAYVADLGMDKIMVYLFDSTAGKLVPHGVPWARLPDGSGPRHFSIHPNERYAYVVGELDSTVTLLSYDTGSGSLRAVQSVSALPPGWSGVSVGADLHIHPSGRFLYSSNRGHDSITVFAIEEHSGTLRAIDWTPTGKTPRNFAIDPTGSYLVAANQESDTVVSYRIDRDTGRLHPTGSTIAVPSPACVLFRPTE